MSMKLDHSDRHRIEVRYWTISDWYVEREREREKQQANVDQWISLPGTRLPRHVHYLRRCKKLKEQIGAWVRAIVKDKTRSTEIPRALPSLRYVYERIDSLEDCERPPPRRNTNRNHRSPSRSSASYRLSWSVDWHSDWHCLLDCSSIGNRAVRDEFLHPLCEHPAASHSVHFHLLETYRHALDEDHWPMITRYERLLFTETASNEILPPARSNLLPASLRLL